jgi:methyl-accepting chemotaxis protein
MRAWFNRLSIQNLLFAICGSIILIAAFSVGIDTFNTVRMQAENSILLRLFDRLEETYTVQTILQSAESLGRQFVHNPDPHLADEMEGYRIQFDTFLREASLRAETAEEKAALYELERIAQAYDDTYLALARAVSAQDPIETSRLVVQSVEYTDAMEEQIGILMHQSLTAFAETDEKMLVRDITTMVISFLALLLFILLAVAAARIINHRVTQPVMLLTDVAKAVTQATSSGTMTVEFAPDLSQLLATSFNQGELRALCSRLKLDYDDLPGQGKTDKARELVAQLEQRSRLAEMVGMIHQQHPHIVDQAPGQRIGDFDPVLLAELASHTDEMGQLARAFVRMTEAVRLREKELQKQADEIRAKIEQAS